MPKTEDTLRLKCRATFEQNKPTPISTTKQACDKHGDNTANLLLSQRVQEHVPCWRSRSSWQPVAVRTSYQNTAVQRISCAHNAVFPDLDDGCRLE